MPRGRAAEVLSLALGSLRESHGDEGAAAGDAHGDAALGSALAAQLLSGGASQQDAAAILSHAHAHAAGPAAAADGGAAAGAPAPAPAAQGSIDDPAFRGTAAAALAKAARDAHAQAGAAA